MEDFEPIAGYPNKRSMLEALYVQEELSISQIASRIGMGTATIAGWLRNLGIPARSRGGRNNTGKIAWTLHRIDPRLIFRLSIRELAKLVQASESRVWKYKEGVRATWNSVL